MSDYLHQHARWQWQFRTQICIHRDEARERKEKQDCENHCQREEQEDRVSQSLTDLLSHRDLVTTILLMPQQDSSQIARLLARFECRDIQTVEDFRMTLACSR